MSDSYVTSKATMKCSCGDRQAKLTVYPDRTVFLTEKPMANISDHISLYNIAPFGRCHTTRYPATGAATAANHGRLTPMPCIPGTVTEWINGKNDYIIKGKPALLKSSYCRCKWGGVITITDDGQVDTGEADLSREQVTTEEEMKAATEAKQQLDPEAVLDGIQLALDVAGLAPGVGAIPDLLNASISALRGDWGAAGLSVLAAVPVIGDAATAAKFAKKGVKVAKAAKKVKAVGKVADTPKENVFSISEFKTTKTKRAIENSENVYPFHSKNASNTELSTNKVGQKQDNVVRMDKYERKVEKQINGPDKITTIKKTDVVAMDNHRRVEPVHKPTYTGSSTSYGAGQNNGSSSYSSSENRKQNRIKYLRDKKMRGQLSESERKELKELDPNSGSLFD